MTEVIYLVLLLFMFIPAYVLMQHDDWDDEATTARIQRAAARCWRWLAALLAVSFLLSAVFYYQLSTFSLCFGGAIIEVQLISGPFCCLVR